MLGYRTVIRSYPESDYRGVLVVSVLCGIPVEGPPEYSRVSLSIL
jgi:hypothetical protein